MRSPLWRSLRRLVAKKGMKGTSGTFHTQNEALVPHIQSSSKAVADPRRTDQAGVSSSQVVKTPLWIR